MKKKAVLAEKAMTRYGLGEKLVVDQDGKRRLEMHSVGKTAFHAHGKKRCSITRLASSEKTASIHVEKTRLGRLVAKRSLIHEDSGVGSVCFSQKSPVG